MGDHCRSFIIRKFPDEREMVTSFFPFHRLIALPLWFCGCKGEDHLVSSFLQLN